MMPSAVPPGRQREQELAERLDEVRAEIEELHSALPSVNDPVLRTPAQALVEAAASVMTAHQGRPGPDIADDLAGLMSAAHTLRVPVQDPALGRTEALQTLRKAKGLIVTALGEALDAARALGLYPREAPLWRELPTEVPRTGNEGLLRGIAKRLDEVVGRLDALDNEKAVPTAFPQQTGLLNFYIGAMRVEVDLARLHLTLGEETIDFGALARAVEVMTELTGDFLATVRAWIGRVSDAVTRIAEGVRVWVRRLAAGTGTAAKWIERKARLAHAAPGEPSHPALLDGGAGEDEFVSEDDLLSFEGWAKYQGFDPAALTPPELKEWRGIFDEMMERRKTSPKLGLMKLERRDGEQRYAVVIRDGSDLWLTFWVRCSPKGEIFLMYPRADPGNPHVSYHLDGTLHQKSHGTVGISQKRQPLTAAFRGSEHLGLYSGHGTKSIGAVFDREAFDGVVTVEPGMLGPRDGDVGVDLVEPGYEPEWEREVAPRFYPNGVYQRKVFPRNGRPSVVITIHR
jgi:hypothetical protein